MAAPYQTLLFWEDSKGKIVSFSFMFYFFQYLVIYLSFLSWLHILNVYLSPQWNTHAGKNKRKRKKKIKKKNNTKAKEYDHQPQGGLQKILKIILERKRV